MVKQVLHFGKASTLVELRHCENFPRAVWAYIHAFHAERSRRALDVFKYSLPCAVLSVVSPAFKNINFACYTQERIEQVLAEFHSARLAGLFLAHSETLPEVACAQAKDIVNAQPCCKANLNSKLVRVSKSREYVAECVAVYVVTPHFFTSFSLRVNNTKNVNSFIF